MSYTVSILGATFVVAAALPLALDRGSIALAVLLFVALGAQVHKVSILLHECVHGTLFDDGRWNHLIGRTTAAFLALDLSVFARSHFHHHRTDCGPDDEEGRVYAQLVNATRRRLVWQVVAPLFGSVLLERRRKPVTNAASVATDARQSGKWQLWFWVAAAQGWMACLVSGFGHIWWAAPAYVLSAATVGAFFSRLRGFCEHIPPAGWEHQGFVRTHRRHWFERWVFYTLGMNYHLEHHMYPTVPGYRLRKISEALQQQWHTTQTQSNSMIATVVSRIWAATS